MIGSVRARGLLSMATDHPNAPGDDSIQPSTSPLDFLPYTEAGALARGAWDAAPSVVGNEVGAVRGSVQARDAMKTPELRDVLNSWLRGPGRGGADRNALAAAEIPDAARQEMLRRLSAQTAQRINPETDEREFQLFRGNHTLNDLYLGPQDVPTSWTPDAKTAYVFGSNPSTKWGAPKSILSGWIPEEKLGPYLNTLGNVNEFGFPRGEAPYRAEHEVLVKPLDSQFDARVKNVQYSPSDITPPANVHEAINERARYYGNLPENRKLPNRMGSPEQLSIPKKPGDFLLRQYYPILNDQ